MGLDVNNLEISRNGVAPLPPLSIRVNPGETLSLMGRSGIGKSTILAAIAGSLDPELSMKGEISIDGRRVESLPMEKRNIGILYQDALLFPHLSAGENLGFGVRVRGEARAEMMTRMLARLGLEGFENRDPATLSGGEAARIALGRALLAKPGALLLDEPFSRLDQELRHDVRALVFDEIATREIPAVLVTHDISDAKAAGGEIITL